MGNQAVVVLNDSGDTSLAQENVKLVKKTVFLSGIPDNPNASLSHQELCDLVQHIDLLMADQRYNIEIFEVRTADFGRDGSNGTEEIYNNAKPGIDPNTEKLKEFHKKIFDDLKEIKSNIYQGLFSDKCLECGTNIDLQRLMLMPAAKCCRKCCHGST